MKIVVYGSLREGTYNYERFKSSYPEIEKIETSEIEGFALHDLGAFPCAVKGKGTLVVDVLIVPDEAYVSIRNMELGAGYDEIEMKVGEHTGFMYTYKQSDAPIVESGDWIKYLNNEN